MMNVRWRMPTVMGLGAVMLCLAAPNHFAVEAPKKMCWWECYDCSAGQGMWWDETWTQNYGDVLYERSCTAEACGGDNCDVALQDVVGQEGHIAALATAVARRDHAAMRTQLRILRAAAELNTERGALQVVGCDDQIVAHIPLGPTIMAAIDD